MAVALKELYSKEYIELLSKTIKKHYKKFKKEAFKQKVFNDTWEEKALKTRTKHIATSLAPFLTQAYQKDIKILKFTFNELNYAYSLENIIFQEYVALFGLEDFETSMQALAVFTLNSTSEFAIRQFLIRNEAMTLHYMRKWTLDKNEHIRRLASEGCRPRLPWGVTLTAFKKDPSKVIGILELLKDDSSAYVQKSVANNLNDISKDNPEIFIALLQKWLKENDKRKPMLQHASRTLLKAGNREVLELFGFHERSDIALKNMQYDSSVYMGNTFSFSFELQSHKELGMLRVEFMLHFLRKNKKHTKKVFQIAQKEFKNSSAKFSKNYSFKKITTRVYYVGPQELSIIVNGVRLKSVKFELLTRS